MKFKLIQGFPTEVEDQIQQLLEDGWKLHGNLIPFEFVGTNQKILIQAMTYEEPSPKMKYYG